MTGILPPGFRAAGAAAGIKPKGRGLDLGLLLADEPAPARALFTRNRLRGAHIPVCREHLDRGGHRVRAVLVNSGNANCATGERGRDDARRLCEAVADRIGCAEEHVLSISTGVIGAHLPLEKILAAIGPLCDAADPDGVEAFARAILTTDTRPKTAARELEDGRRALGIAKGSGMIHPDLATMLGFLLTDADPGPDPDAMLARIAERTFHRLSVDGDTSPNDTVLLWSSAREDGEGLEAVLEDVGRDLCRQLAADGEGATRLVTVEVRGARSAREAADVGRLIATSPLTKTAITGRDPNWGRILSAAGRAGVPFDPGRARVWIGDVTVFEHGHPHPEREADASSHLQSGAEVRIGIDLALGDGEADAWTCDLTADYVRINADYRT